MAKRKASSGSKKRATKITKTPKKSAKVKRLNAKPESSEERAAKIADHNARSRLLSLPTEIRTIIYKFAMAESPVRPWASVSNKIYNPCLSAHEPLALHEPDGQLIKNGLIFTLRDGDTEAKDLEIKVVFGNFQLRLVSRAVNHDVQSFALSAFTHDRRSIGLDWSRKQSLFRDYNDQRRMPVACIREFRIILGYRGLDCKEQWRYLAEKLPNLDKLILEVSKECIDDKYKITEVMSLVRGFSARHTIIAVFDTGYYAWHDRTGDEFLNALEAMIRRGRNGPSKFRSYSE